MTTVTGASFWRDANFVPITTDGLPITTTHSLTGNNTTVHDAIFGITGTVEIRALWGVVTTVLGANNTAANFRLNDQTAQVQITSAAGTTLSAAPVGSAIVKNGLAAAAVTLISSSAGGVNEPTTLETTFFSPFTVVQKTAGVATNIEFSYSTTDTPTSGAIQFFCKFLPLSATANITAL